VNAGNSSGGFTLTDDTLQGNSANGGTGGQGGNGATTGGTGGTGGNGEGGGLFMGASSITIDVSQDTFFNNTAQGGNGGTGGPGNTHNGNGGTGGAGEGGGADNEAGTTNFTNDTFAANNATGGNGGAPGNNTNGSAGAQGNGGNGEGGGIFNDNIVNLLNDTVAGSSSSVSDSNNPLFAKGNNAAGGTGASNGTGTGGGLFNNGGTFNVQNTIIANNTADTDPDASGSFSEPGGNGYNLITNNSSGSFSSGNHDQIGVDPFLSVLGNFGGPTKTMLPLGFPESANPAIDNGLASIAPVTDQRGVIRPDETEANVDIGAVETTGMSVSISPTTQQQQTVSAFTLAFNNQLTVHVQENNDANNVLGGPINIPGVLIQFVASNSNLNTGGAGGRLSSSTQTKLGTVTQATGSNGNASVTAFTNEITGTWTVTPSNPALTGLTSTFSLKNIGTVTHLSVSLTGTSEDHPHEIAEHGGHVNVTITVTDQFGNPLPGVPVTITQLNDDGHPVGTGAHATVSPPSGTTTNASGQVTFTLTSNGKGGKYQVIFHAGSLTKTVWLKND
jgi:hypothetical protein